MPIIEQRGEEDDPEGYRRSPLLGVWEPRTRKAKSVIREVESAVAAFEAGRRKANQGSRRRRRSAQERFDAALQAVLCELTVCWLRGDGEIGLRYARSRLGRSQIESRAARDGNTLPPAINPLLPQAVDVLEAIGYVRQLIGERDRERRIYRQTIMWPGPKLIAAARGVSLSDFRESIP